MNPYLLNIILLIISFVTAFYIAISTDATGRSKYFVGNVFLSVFVPLYGLSTLFTFAF